MTKLFLKDKRGTSEEFTSLPALMVVMIGFALFFALMATTYMTYHQKLDEKELYEAAHHAVLKLTLPESPLISEGDTDTPLIVSASISDISANDLTECCNLTGYDYRVKIYYYDEQGEKRLLPGTENLFTGTHSSGDTVSASRKIAVKFADGEIRYGKIVVTVWRKEG